MELDVVTINNMKADLLLHERMVLNEKAFADLVVWRVPRAVPGSAHPYKYRLAYVISSKCLIRFDNEAGKGDHCHLGEDEVAYEFESLEKLLEDFWRLVDKLRGSEP